jgi:hypothetical protein
MSPDVRALVSQEHVSSIYVRFRSPLGNIVTPILLDESLSGLWTESSQELLELGARCPLPLTCNKNIILNHHTRPETITTRSEDRLTTSYVILVYLPSTDLMLSSVKSWLFNLEGKKQLFSPLVGWNMIFLEWRALGSLKEDLADSSQLLTEFLRGYIVYKDGSLGFGSGPHRCGLH